MTIANAGGSDGFEPPKYLASLIAAINDGAKAAQAGALLFALVGLYLLATAFSASDEDLLRGRAVTISQIGATLPVTFSFAIAPLVFVFLHIYTLARYDMLAANVRQFLAELRRSVVWEVDRERCRHLLANVEFIQALIAPRGSGLYNPGWRWLIRAMIAGFPVFVLLLVQINALRYQSGLINAVQRVWLFTDLFALVLFFERNALTGPEPRNKRIRAQIRPGARLLWLRVVRLAQLLYSTGLGRFELPAERPDGPTGRWVYPLWLRAAVFGRSIYQVALERPGWSTEAIYTTIRRWFPLLWLPAVVIVLNLLYVNVVPVDADRGLVRTSAVRLVKAFSQPLDAVVCPELKWGCRYLRVSDRTLVDHVWDDKAIVALRNGDADKAVVHAAIEGLVLRDRSFRFAVLDKSSLFAADLTEADLRSASVSGARLQGADLSNTRLQGADLRDAELRDAVLKDARLQGADLRDAALQDADLEGAHLQKAILVGARLPGAVMKNIEAAEANFERARLPGADLDNADLRGAYLWEAHLQGANLVGAHLQGANLAGAQFQGATLIGAELQFALMNGANLQAADLDGANLLDAAMYRAKLQGAILTGASLQGAALTGGQLQGASLRGALLQNVVMRRGGDLFGPVTDLSLCDLRRIDFTTQPDEDMIRAAIEAIPKKPQGELFAMHPTPELGSVISAMAAPSVPLQFTASVERPVAVSDLANAVFDEVPKDWLIASPTSTYSSERRALGAVLANELASADPRAVQGIARRVNRALSLEDAGVEEDRLVYAPIACRLTADVEASKVKPEPAWTNDLRATLKEHGIECTHPKSESPVD